MNVLTRGDLTTDTWRRLKEHYEAKLTQLRAKNDADLDDAETARLRGRIQEIKDFLALANPAPEVEDSSRLNY